MYFHHWGPIPIPIYVGRALFIDKNHEAKHMSVSYSAHLLSPYYTACEYNDTDKRYLPAI